LNILQNIAFDERAFGSAHLQTGPLSDEQILQLIANGEITYDDPEPDNDRSKGAPKGVPWGPTHHGIDLRIDDKFRLPENLGKDEIVTPGDGKRVWREVIHRSGVMLAPGKTCLAQTKEVVSIPANCVGILQNRSTWLRYFLFVLSSPIEAGWRGRITLELVYLGSQTLWIPAHQGIAQLQFFAGGPSRVTYADKRGKYQDQTEPTPGIIREGD
jgi:deoxycytidine triphosphate deaminase